MFTARAVGEGLVPDESDPVGASAAGPRGVHRPTTETMEREIAAAMELDIARAKRARRIRGALILVGQVTLGVSVLWLWQTGSDRHWWRELFFSSPRGVWEFFADNPELLWTNSLATAEAAIFGFALGAASGIVAGLLLAAAGPVGKIFDPLIVVMNSLPRIALAPLFILLFGLGLEAKVALSVSIVFFITLVSARAGTQAVDEDQLVVSRVLGLSKWQLYWKIVLPSSSISIFAALRLSVVYSILGVVASEFIGARDGLGQQIVYGAAALEPARIFAAATILAFLAVVLNAAVGLVQRFVLRWRG